MIELRGISWDHPRGHDCMVATSEAYMERNPQVRITWDTRSLKDFGDLPIERLTDRYDLLIIDHPFVGFAAADGCLLPLDEYLDEAFLADQAANSVGPSHRSYVYDGHQWALATDAAGHVAAYRPDLLDQIGGLPRTWDDVIRAAEMRRDKETARVAVPLVPTDAIMCFCSICTAHGEEPFATDNCIVSRSMGRQALQMLRALVAAAHPESLSWNPPKTLDRMSTTDEIAYIPLLFGYSNYGRPGFRTHIVKFTGVPTVGGGPSRGGILGGAGLAISSRTQHPEAAADFARFAASGEIQRTIYFTAGGQPGHRSAWLDDAVNEASSDFFRDTLDSLDRAYLRPRYNGYLPVQERSGDLINAFLRDGGDIDETLDALDDLYRSSRRAS